MIRLVLTFTSLTKSIGSLMVSHALEDSKPHQVQKYMASSTVTHKCHDDVPTHIFTDLPLLHVTKASRCTLEVQHINLPSIPQIDSILSAPPSWKLQEDVPVHTQVTVGYNAFVAQYEQSYSH
jgi:hypothetical protein